MTISGFCTGRALSRRDEILLTVDFNLRTMDTTHAIQVPQGRHFGAIIVSSLRDFGTVLHHLSRRLKSTVNKVLSLLDNLRDQRIPLYVVYFS